MPAHRKPVALHKLHGTYQPCRHDERAAKAAANHERTIPQWLPDNVKPVYKKLMETLPPLDAVDETPLAQMATLKTQLQEDPDSMTSAQHGQLRQLAGMIREWVRDYQVTSEEPVLDEFDAWERRRKGVITYEQYQQNRAKQPMGDNKYPIPDSPCIRNGPEPETNSQGRKKIPLPQT